MIFEGDFARFFELAGLLYMKSKRALSRSLEKHGITWDQFGTLAAIGRESGMSQRRLAAILETDTTTAMVICDSLEKRSLIERSRDRSDRRVNRLILTDAGSRTLSAAMKTAGKMYEQFKTLLSDDELAAALPVLQKAAMKAKEISQR